MCNVYEPPKPERLAEAFGAQLWLDIAYPTFLAPLKPGPFVLGSGDVKVGQWGMIPRSSATRIPMTSKGGRMSTNNARREGMAKAWTFGPAWKEGRRCLIPTETFQEPNWGPLFEPFKKSIAWQFSRVDGAPWALAGLWDLWADPETGELVPSYAMTTQNCDGHPLLALMHRPELDGNKETLPPEKQDKKAVVPIERERWDEWLHGIPEQADSLINVPALELFSHGAAEPAKSVPLPGLVAQDKNTIPTLF